MPFVKVQKTNAYYKRYQVKYARRRSGKTDYRARKRLVAVDKNKYLAPRHRLVVRITARYVICQVVYSEMDGDRVLASAYSSELPRYGLKVGLKNYAAAYCTGLLVARRILTKLGLAETYQGNEEIDGKVTKTTSNGREFWVAEVNEDRKPFRCVLDVGIRTTTTGARVFGAMKGASDGGLDIPHNHKRFPGYNRDEKKFDPEELKEHIFGGHIAGYMEELQEEDPESYERRFSTFVEAGVEPADLEDLYISVHAAIRADPSPVAKKAYKSPAEFKKPARSTNEERKARVAAKKTARLAQLKAAMADDE